MRHHLSVFILLISALFSHVRIALACESQPNYWFAEIYSIGSMLLPEHVTIELSPKDSAKGYFLINNDSDTPLYVLPQEVRTVVMVTQEVTLAEDGLSEENTPEEILLIDQVPSLAAFTVTRTAPLRLDTDNFTALVPYIEERNIIDFSRPSFVYLPISQRGEFHLVHGEQIFTVQFAISYALNENFSPVVCGEAIELVPQQTVAFAEESNKSTLISTISFGAILLVTVGAMLWIRKK